ncbi:ABC transporter permease [Dactylosporangium salmoneum]|uniref:ABC transporter permease n=1 Tax=Dactylosporangium salmoneum TaxID=53361 RepID=A0ABP5TSX7_9ACTN
MWWFALKRIVTLVPVMIVVSMATFGLILAVPGDPAARIAGPNATDAQIALIREQLGVNDPVVVQYLHWLGGAVTGDLGDSLMFMRPVTDLIAERLPVTVTLALVALLFGTVGGVILGTIAATRKNKFVDKASMVLSSAGIATPNYWLALLLVLLFALTLRWLPVGEYVPFTEDPAGWAQHLILPGIALGAAFGAETARQVRSAIVEVKELPYVTTARSQGLRRGMVLGKYVAKNAAIPVVTVLGLQFTRILGGAVLIEQIFSLPGLGSLMVNAVLAQDMPLIQGVILMTVMVAVVVNTLVDLSYAWLNPKVRSQWA